MKRYRVVKQETTMADGTVKSYYSIQSRCLWCWSNICLRIFVKDVYDRDYNPSRITFLGWEAYHFSSEQNAIDVVKLLRIYSDYSNPYYYKGCRIGVVFRKYSLEPIYINYDFSSKFRYRYSSFFGYEFSETLEGLKKNIDEREAYKLATTKKSTKLTIIE